MKLLYCYCHGYRIRKINTKQTNVLTTSTAKLTNLFKWNELSVGNCWEFNNNNECLLLLFVRIARCSQATHSFTALTQSTHTLYAPIIIVERVHSTPKMKRKTFNLSCVWKIDNFIVVCFGRSRTRQLQKTVTNYYESICVCVCVPELFLSFNCILYLLRYVFMLAKDSKWAFNLNFISNKNSVALKLGHFQFTAKLNTK